jgi:hypothetical protein
VTGVERCRCASCCATGPDPAGVQAKGRSRHRRLRQARRDQYHSSPARRGVVAAGAEEASALPRARAGPDTVPSCRPRTGRTRHSPRCQSRCQARRHRPTAPHVRQKYGTGGLGEVVGSAHPLSDRRHDAPVVAHLSGRREGRALPADPAFRIYDGPVLFALVLGGQQDIGQAGRVGLRFRWSEIGRRSTYRQTLVMNEGPTGGRSECGSPHQGRFFVRSSCRLGIRQQACGAALAVRRQMPDSAALPPTIAGRGRSGQRALPKRSIRQEQ